MDRCPLVLVEWEDSAQPLPQWQWLREFETPTVNKGASVGWLIHDGDDVKALAPNMANIDSETNVQASGIIRIPARCITSIKPVSEE